jgi:ectoine hydroxylase-related dioxygenase (phytanoyl-CoA dioxygenase family)
VGGIVSFPGAADQAIHADTTHLFEHLPDLPAYYIRMFAPGVPFDDSVGGTAFCHGSDNLAFTAKYCRDEDENSRVFPFLVRPSLTLGDAVLFDCRILHFGLSNTSKSIERALLYTNTTHAWFHDPKNWDDRRPIFEPDA